METVLLSIKNKSAGIRLLIKRVREVFAEYENGKEIIDAVISLLCCLDASCQGRCEENNHAKLHQVIAIALDVMENLGGKELPAKRGMKFDPHLHYAMGTEEVDLPDQTISEVVYRGFKVGEKNVLCLGDGSLQPKGTKRTTGTGGRNSRSRNGSTKASGTT